MLAISQMWIDNQDVNSGEFSGGLSEKDRRDAYDFCEEIRHAAELLGQVKQIELTAQRAASGVVSKSMLRNLPYTLEIDISSKVEAYTVRDDEVIEEQPAGFVATEIRSIDEYGVEFYNRHTDTWLRIKGFDFEVYPRFIEIPEE